MVIDMKLRYLYLAFLGMIVASDAMAVKELCDGSIKRANCSNEYVAWMNRLESKFGDINGAGDFILAGAIGTSGGRGTYSDEYAIVAVIAKQIVEHGGYFCPQQIQCSNSNGKKKSWSTYFNPTGFTEDKCVWLCEKGYSGTNCAKQVSVVGGMDTSTNKEGLYSGLSLKQSGKYNGSTEASVPAFTTYTDESGKVEKDVLLGVIDFNEHSVLAGPVSIVCRASGSGNNHSYVDKVARYSGANYKLLCADGYTPTSDNTDCVKMTQEMLNLTTTISDQKKMCAGWSEVGYDSSVHSIDSTGDCVKYMCKDKTKAFPASGNFECTECAGSIRGGQNPLTGLCVKCEQLGQYFDTKTGECKSAMAFTRIDMQYGKGKTKETNTKPENQCWTKVSPEDYKDCVFGKPKLTLSNLKLSVPVAQWSGVSVSAKKPATTYTFTPSTINVSTSTVGSTGLTTVGGVTSLGTSPTFRY